MKTDLSFLPELKQTELAEIGQLICSNCTDVEMIILYGSYARNTYKEQKDLQQYRWSGHISDYDILIVTGTRETARNCSLKYRIEQICFDQNFSAPVQLILFDLQELNIQLAEGQYFYTDVKREGVVLYNPKNHTLAEKRELTSAERARIAQYHFDVWYDMAAGMFRGASFYSSDDNFRLSLFNLHQASEACLKCLLLVFTNYTPATHVLDSLLEKVVREVPAVLEIFPTIDDPNYARFELLDGAYAESRNIRYFDVEKEDMEYLALRVERLLTVTKEACETRIRELRGELFFVDVSL